MLYIWCFVKRGISSREFLKKNKIECSSLSTFAFTKASKQYGYRKGMFPIAEDQAKKLLTIPVHNF